MSYATLLAVSVLVLVWLWTGKVLVPIQSRRNLQQQFGASIEPAGDIDTAVVDSLKALDPERPIREASSAAMQNSSETFRRLRRTILSQ